MRMTALSGDQYEISSGGQVIGPVTLDLLRRGFEAGKIPAEAVARLVGDDRWVSVRDVLRAPVRAAPASVGSVQGAKCPSCGADLKVPAHGRTAHCTYCKKDALLAAPAEAAKVDNRLRLADAAAEAGNYKEAYRYYTKVLEDDPENYEAWFGKGVSAAWDSGLRGDRFSELTSGIDRALQCAPEGVRDLLAKRAASKINLITLSYFQLSVKHTAEFISLDETWSEHVGRCIPIISALSKAHELDPANRLVLQSAIDLCKSMIEGVQYWDEFDRDDDGDSIQKTKHLSPELEQRVRAVMDSFIEKMKRLDPTYAAPTIQKAGEISLIGVLGCLLVLLVLALVAFGIWKLVSEIREVKAIADKPQVDRPTSVPQAAPAPEPARTSHCGDPVHPPRGVSVPRNWSAWTCKSSHQAGPAWSKCLQRTAYSDTEGMGCEGSNRCCPP